MTPAGSPLLLRPAVRVLTRWTLDGVVLLHLDGGDPLLLTGPGATLWSILANGPVPEEDLLTTLAARYGVELELVAHDVSGVLGQLLDLDIVVIEGPRGSRRGTHSGD